MKKKLGLSILFVTLSSLGFAQDLTQVKKDIEAERYDSAKKTLKSLIKTNPDNGKLYYYLGDVYLAHKESDSAQAIFNKGLLAKEKGFLNNIGLGILDLDAKKNADAAVKFDKASKEIKKKDVDETLLIAKAYIQSENPNYKLAIEIINKVLATKVDNAQAHLLLGDAQFASGNSNEAYSSYRNAYDYDNSVILAKMNIAKITKNAKAFNQAVKSFDEIVKTNPNFGPVYRELAETYYFWANSEQDKYQDYITKALNYYEKYMSLTDYSLDSRMRHADFLILAKDYKALEKEASEMKKLDNINPRILRYLGYAAYENGNFAESSKALTEFFVKVDPKRIIARDYLYLGLTKMAEAKKADGTYDEKIFNEGVVELNKAVEKEPSIAGELNPIGRKMFNDKLYKNATKLFEVAIKNPKSKNYTLDNFYLGYALYLDYEVKTSPKEQLTQADLAFSKVIEVSPTTQDAHLYRARVNDLINTPEAKNLTLTSYEQYIKILDDKGDAEKAKPASKRGLIEALTHVGAHYANTGQKDKAVENLKKLLVVDPTNKYASDTLKAL
ncbi:tetratricopeptide repeat protein [Flavobacterium sp. HXWNR69]|uniref:Tetratricopeptide repeat protein n=1 Tax=Flavobacterium fragile TaxID=2949085 RepID=A0ABT0TJL7_9FLAO|nr:tetratricopeptide repeat protein [Flavobacterium sp. HXWNR69]MCL9771002.1 tetratricopeptide repeat protein [Flavobacterium sp. HXWNR69]